LTKREFPDAKILIIDDEPEKIKLVAQLLQIAGLGNTRGESDSTQSVAVYEAFKPDLIVLDLHMEPCDGFQVLRDLRPLVPAGAYVPILVLTGDITQEACERALTEGAMDFLAKPFSAQEIVLRVKNLLHTRLLHVELHAERDHLEERVLERTAELEDARNEILERLALASDFRDDETGEHNHRVAKLTTQLAMGVGIPAEEAELMGRAALLHDVGKIGIPDTILLKPGPLTAEERDVMQTHTVTGGSILKDSRAPLLRMAEVIATSHHEKWDGTGYPSGLVGESIPLPGRIVAVADVYDALTHERPYKKAWSREEALKHIKDLAGVQFDPNVVTALLGILQSWPMAA
jgi:putative two-component system response regulator